MDSCFRAPWKGRHGTVMIWVSALRMISRLGESLMEIILSNSVCPRIFPGTGVLLYLRFPNRPWVWAIKVKPARKYDLEEAEFYEALSSADTPDNMEAVRVYRM